MKIHGPKDIFGCAGLVASWPGLEQATQESSGALATSTGHSEIASTSFPPFPCSDENMAQEQKPAGNNLLKVTSGQSREGL